MIYFLQELEAPFRIKIGFSKKPLTRFQTIAGSLPQKVRLLKIRPGERLDESFLHQTLKPFRVPGTREWYFAEPEVMDWIDDGTVEFAS